MTKTRTTVLAGAAWVTALASTAAFAYAMNRPLTVEPASTPPPPRLVRVEPLPATPPEPAMIVLPTIEIVSHVARHIPVAAAPRPEPRVRDISEMKCTQFKPLEQGAGGVQLCE